MHACVRASLVHDYVMPSLVAIVVPELKHQGAGALSLSLLFAGG